MTLLAWDAGVLVGFARVCPCRDPDLATAGELAALYVLPSTWGHGVGTQLVQAALATLRAATFDEASLWVLDTNQSVIRFYEANGWRDDGTRKVREIAGMTVTVVRYRLRLSRP